MVKSRIHKTLNSIVSTKQIVAGRPNVFQKNNNNNIKKIKIKILHLIFLKKKICPPIFLFFQFCPPNPKCSKNITENVLGLTKNFSRPNIQKYWGKYFSEMLLG
jgi:hypothetical protein